MFPRTTHLGGNNIRFSFSGKNTSLGNSNMYKLIIIYCSLKTCAFNKNKLNIHQWLNFSNKNIMKKKYIMNLNNPLNHINKITP